MEEEIISMTMEEDNNQYNPIEIKDNRIYNNYVMSIESEEDNDKDSTRVEDRLADEKKRLVEEEKKRFTKGEKKRLVGKEEENSKKNKRIKEIERMEENIKESRGGYERERRNEKGITNKRPNHKKTN
ncbi:hypothetical protein, conserved [Entamoeba histolytica]